LLLRVGESELIASWRSLVAATTKLRREARNLGPEALEAMRDGDESVEAARSGIAAHVA
jgi:hypothetical protein